MLEVRSWVVEESMPTILDTVEPEDEGGFMSKLEGVSLKEDDAIVWLLVLLDFVMDTVIVWILEEVIVWVKVQFEDDATVGMKEGMLEGAGCHQARIEDEEPTIGAV